MEISVPQFQDDAYHSTPAWSGGNEETIELYDSGASQHMSPYHHRFLNFKSISPHPIQAADKRTFDTIGRGDLPNKVPNGKTTTCILLTNVLYVLLMGTTLISISRLTRAGYAALFCSNTCRIFDQNKKQLGEVLVSRNLYWTKHKPTSFRAAASGPKTLTMEEMHQRLAHPRNDGQGYDWGSQVRPQQ